ncbi:SDR family oxidoreductase [Streptomyces sp. NPDC005805]|uniref:SDR family NAD(P)-dependent oxidoreductase n=1 Tax=Streptomyces sp. NPDC005805 TaxID=3157068 RepID=UPI0033C29971
MVSGLRGKRAVVTGAGSGIGRATALELAAHGASVSVVDMNPRTADSVCEEISSAGGIAHPHIADLRGEHAPSRVMADAVGALGGIDILVNNAGVVGSAAGPAQATDEEWEDIMLTNVTAPFRLIRCAVPHMSGTGGSIVNVASAAGLRGSAAGTAYTVSKHALVGLTLSAAVYLRGQDIRVNAVSPGATLTNMRVPSRVELQQDEKIIECYRNNRGRVSHPHDIAHTILFLASDLARQVTGVVVPVDNGWNAV